MAPTSPLVGDVHIDQALTNVSIAYIQDTANYIAPSVFPLLQVAKKTDYFWKYDKDDFLLDDVTVRAEGTESAGTEYGLSQDTYACDVYALHKDVTDPGMASEDDVLDAKRDAAPSWTQTVWRKVDRQLVADALKAGVWGTDLGGVAAAPGAGEFIQWSDYTNSDPIEDIEGGQDAIQGVTGYEPNILVIDRATFRVLRNHPDFIERTKYTTPESVTLAMLAAWFELDKVVVSKAVYNSAAQDATGVYVPTFAKGAFLAYVNPNPSPRMPSAGYTFSWDEVSQGMGENISVVDFPIPELRSDRIEVQSAWDNKIVAPDLGVFFADTIA